MLTDYYKELNSMSTENKRMIKSISKTEYITDDNEVHPIPFELDEPLPSVEEFQKVYNHWFSIFKKEELLSNDD